ncbi:MAG: IclR family transcriptional regulator [Paracoccaceae bacterium]
MSEKRGRGRPKNPFTEQNIGTVQAVERALQILSTLASSDRMSLTELSLSVGVPAATTHRLLNTLQKHEFVVFDTERQDWLIGVEAFRVGASFLKRRDLLQISKPIMQRLMEDTGETANLAIRNGANVIFIGQVETTHPIRAFFPPSTETSMHASGTGKAILAALQQDQVEKLLTKSGLSKFTDKTLVRPQHLFDDLEQTRERGWSFDQEERHIGMSCIASAIYDADGRPFAGVSISGPSERFVPSQVDLWGQRVRAAATQITAKIGGHAHIKTSSSSQF